MGIPKIFMQNRQFIALSVFLKVLRQNLMESTEMHAPTQKKEIIRITIHSGALSTANTQMNGEKTQQRMVMSGNKIGDPMIPTAVSTMLARMSAGIQQQMQRKAHPTISSAKSVDCMQLVSFWQYSQLLRVDSMSQIPLEQHFDEHS